MSVKDEVVRFLATKSKLPVSELHDLTELYSSGTFSSLTVVELVTHLEKTFDVEISASDMNENTFKHVRSVSELMERLLSHKDTAVVNA